jgi:hypothetical protein
MSKTEKLMKNNNNGNNETNKAMKNNENNGNEN